MAPGRVSLARFWSTFVTRINCRCAICTPKIVAIGDDSCVFSFGRTYGVGRLVEEAMELGRKEGRADEAQEEEPAHGPEHGLVAELLRHLFAISPVSFPTVVESQANENVRHRECVG